MVTFDFSNAIYFYATNEPYGEFSNFYPASFYEDCVRYLTVEHYYQAHKFTDPKYRAKIIQAPTAKEAALLGRSRTVPIRTDWDEVRDEIMMRGLTKKFTAHPEILKLLIETGDKQLIENSPYDHYWGIGKNGTGRNRLGEMLMQIRDGQSKI
jgi:ribA/ribD-fused uncharacterized protein